MELILEKRNSKNTYKTLEEDFHSIIIKIIV
jgi:hypothetical protein